MVSNTLRSGLSYLQYGGNRHVYHNRIENTYDLCVGKIKYQVSRSCEIDVCVYQNLFLHAWCIPGTGIYYDVPGTYEVPSTRYQVHDKLLGTYFWVGGVRSAPHARSS